MEGKTMKKNIIVAICLLLVSAAAQAGKDKNITKEQSDTTVLKTVRCPHCNKDHVYRLDPTKPYKAYCTKVAQYTRLYFWIEPVNNE